MAFRWAGVLAGTVSPQLWHRYTRYSLCGTAPGSAELPGGVVTRRLLHSSLGSRALVSAGPFSLAFGDSVPELPRREPFAPLNAGSRFVEQGLKPGRSSEKQTFQVIVVDRCQQDGYGFSVSGDHD